MKNLAFLTLIILFYACVDEKKEIDNPLAQDIVSNSTQKVEDQLTFVSQTLLRERVIMDPLSRNAQQWDGYHLVFGIPDFGSNGNVTCQFAIEVPAFKDLDLVDMTTYGVGQNDTIVYLIKMKYDQSQTIPRLHAFDIDLPAQTLNNAGLVCAIVVDEDFWGRTKNVDKVIYTSITSTPNSWVNLVPNYPIPSNSAIIPQSIHGQVCNDFELFVDIPDSNAYSGTGSAKTMLALGLDTGMQIDRVETKNSNDGVFYCYDIYASQGNSGQNDIFYMELDLPINNFNNADSVLVRVFDNGSKDKERIIVAKTARIPKSFPNRF